MTAMDNAQACPVYVSECQPSERHPLLRRGTGTEVHGSFRARPVEIATDVYNLHFLGSWGYNAGQNRTIPSLLVLIIWPERQIFTK